jgi:putative ABC transport system permease protein
MNNMIYNYLLVFWRNLGRQKLFSLINIVGLSIAISFGALTFLYIKSEYSFDTFHHQQQLIYRVNVKTLDGLALQRGEKEYYQHSAYLPNALGDALRSQSADVDKVMLMKSSSLVIKVSDKAILQDVTFVDSTFFTLFSFPLVKGGRHQLLHTMTDAVINEELAEKLFGTEDPIGQMISIESENLTNSIFIVRAVAHCPANSSIQFQLLLPMAAYKVAASISWNINSYPTFIKVRPHADMNKLKAEANHLLTVHRSSWIDAMRDYFNLEDDFIVAEYSFTALKAIHFDNRVGWPNVSNPKYPWIIASIALLIILIAAINYISFALTQSAARRKEIGIRKTVGARSSQLFLQFNTEAIMACLLAALAGLMMAALLLPVFNSLAQVQLSFISRDFFWLVLFVIVLACCIGFIAGSYPSFYIIKMKVVSALKGRVANQPVFVKPLIVLQFTISVFLMISAVIMYRQLHFIASKDLGFKSDYVISFATNLGWGPESDHAVTRYRNAIRSKQGVLEVSGSSGSYIKGGMSMTYKYQGEEKLVHICRVDDRYLSLLDIPLVLGRNFEAGRPADSTAVLVNEALVKNMGWTNAIGEVLKLSDRPEDVGYTVIGVVKDYHFLSLEEEIQPLMLTGSAQSGIYQITLLAKLDGSNLPQALQTAEATWKELYPDKPFEYVFADEQVAVQYASYQRWMSIAGAATIISMLIAGMGLFGLSGIYTLRRTKEMSIRKVMGANVRQLFILLNKPFAGMSIYAFIIALPFSIYVMNQWLANFTYREEINWLVFMVCFVSLLLIVLVTVSYHSLKIARVNPADTLKDE